MKVNLYFNFIKVKTVKIKDEDWKKDYVVTIWNKKKLFGYFKTTVVLRPVKLLHSTEKSLDVLTVLYEGAEIVE
jgi:hypothetical protein